MYVTNVVPALPVDVPALHKAVPALHAAVSAPRVVIPAFERESRMRPPGRGSWSAGFPLRACGNDDGAASPCTGALARVPSFPPLSGNPGRPPGARAGLLDSR